MFMKQLQWPTNIKAGNWPLPNPSTLDQLLRSTCISRHSYQKETDKHNQHGKHNPILILLRQRNTSNMTIPNTNNIMSSYTPIQLPYFAPAHTLPAALPTTDEILLSTDFLSPSWERGKKTVVRVGEHFIAKYGTRVKSIEGENMLFVGAQTSIPVPRVYAIYAIGPGLTMLITEYVAGITLERYLSTMTPTQVSESCVVAQLRAQIRELRAIPSQGYYGSIGRRPYSDPEVDGNGDGEYENENGNGNGNGPFADLADVTRLFFETWFPARTSTRLAGIREDFANKLKDLALALPGHAHPTFSHADLHNDNVLVRADDDGNSIPVIIDYETAGFYPAYHERIHADSMHRRLDLFGDEFTEERELVKEAQKVWAAADREEDLMMTVHDISSPGESLPEGDLWDELSDSEYDGDVEDV
ncbi:hypothetical protein F4777DRAFT_264844 [Nemania sp. FL0916]|nr:hypothetical protein F4777DRAFT_264844 [Nemania sp. FL0916]